MGEHKDDLTIEQITERRTLEEARQLAEKEMFENMRLAELSDDCAAMVGPHENETTLKEQLSRMEPWNSSVLDDKAIQESMYEDANSLFDSSVNGDLKWPSLTHLSQDVSRKSTLKQGNDHVLTESGVYKSSESLNDSSSVIAGESRELNVYNGSDKTDIAEEKPQVLPSTSIIHVNLIENSDNNANSVNTYSERVNTETGNAAVGLSTMQGHFIKSYTHLPCASGAEDAWPDHSILSEQQKPAIAFAEDLASPALFSGNYSTYHSPKTQQAQFISPQNMKLGEYGAVKFRSIPARHNLLGIHISVVKYTRLLK
ncbi:unnamed protein product [Gongylonema pulchrum]|uniref:Clathrin light chain n=1 Tax=Gongylonema pulchrum TaxID=637853 RepID=A0A183DFD7_9BILA|nr:unnamed protein product [Gongylonema pulchrum]